MTYICFDCYSYFLWSSITQQRMQREMPGYRKEGCVI